MAAIITKSNLGANLYAPDLNEVLKKAEEILKKYSNATGVEVHMNSDSSISFNVKLIDGTEVEEKIEPEITEEHIEETNIEELPKEEINEPKPLDLDGITDLVFAELSEKARISNKKLTELNTTIQNNNNELKNLAHQKKITNKNYLKEKGFRDHQAKTNGAYAQYHKNFKKHDENATKLKAELDELEETIIKINEENQKLIEEREKINNELIVIAPLLATYYRERNNRVENAIEVINNEEITDKKSLEEAKKTALAYARSQLKKVANKIHYNNVRIERIRQTIEMLHKYNYEAAAIIVELKYSIKETNDLNSPHAKECANLILETQKYVSKNNELIFHMINELNNLSNEIVYLRKQEEKNAAMLKNVYDRTRDIEKTVIEPVSPVVNEEETTIQEQTSQREEIINEQTNIREQEERRQAEPQIILNTGGPTLNGTVKVDETGKNFIIIYAPDGSELVKIEIPRNIIIPENVNEIQNNEVNLQNQAPDLPTTPTDNNIEETYGDSEWSNEALNFFNEIGLDPILLKDEVQNEPIVMDEETESKDDLFSRIDSLSYEDLLKLKNEFGSLEEPSLNNNMHK